MELIDIHAHILPGVDDGSRGMEESETMLSMAYCQGIRRIIATPHYSRRRGSGGLAELADRLNARAQAIYGDFEILPGHETYYYEGLAEALKSGQALTLAGSRYVLVEFDPGVSYRQLYQGVRKLIMARYVPVLAHMERYLCLRDEGNFRELTQCDCRMQMNYDSLAGPFWDPGVRWCRKKVEGGCIHLLATDMHRVDYRKPDLEKPMAWLQKHVGERRLRAMVWDNPLAIMKNERMG